MAGDIIQVTDGNFQAEVLEAEGPVLVDFWAPWCGPCRIVAPHLEELNNERDDLRVVKLNTDENPQTAATYNVMSIPTLLLFKNGQVAHQIIGALPKNRLGAGARAGARLAGGLDRGPAPRRRSRGRTPPAVGGSPPTRDPYARPPPTSRI